MGVLPVRSPSRYTALFVDALHQGHDELGLGCDGILLAVAGNHEHHIQSIPATGVEPDNGCRLTAESFHDGNIFSLRVADQNVIIRGQNQNQDQKLR